MFDVEDLVKLNQSVGETGQLLNRSLLESSLASIPYYDTLALQIASVCRSIIQNHPFVDGNKRTGIWFALCAARIAGVRVIVPDAEELTKIAVAIATERWSVEKIARWIEHG
jgi:death-on-curing protein